MNKTAKLHWEVVEQHYIDYAGKDAIQSSTDMSRAKIPTGWLVEETTSVSHIVFHYQSGNDADGYDFRVTLTYVFDPFHLWKE
jgi:hypothetical protein